MSTFNELIYVVMNTIDFTIEKQNMVRASVHTEVDSLITSNDGTKTIVVFTAQFSEPFVGYDWYTKEEMQLEIAKAEYQEQTGA